MIGIDNIYGLMAYDIVLTHNAQNYNHNLIKNGVSKTLLVAVQEGKFPPENYAFFEEMKLVIIPMVALFICV